MRELHKLKFEKRILGCLVGGGAGDSDSTGAVPGNLIGARLGAGGIAPEWKDHLELYDVMTDFANRFGACL